MRRNEINEAGGSSTKSTRVIVPTLNAADQWPGFASAVRDAVLPEHVLVLDSASTDGTSKLAMASGFAVHVIAREEFNHGGTRQLGINLSTSAEIVIFLTQDAILRHAESIELLLAAFDDPSVAAAYGRQLPRPEARSIEAHARRFNYPATSDVRGYSDRERLGLKTAFISNSFAAYRRSALQEVGGFPSNVIFGEDTVTAGRLLLAGWKIAYVAEAQVYHSHAYTCAQEFQRYFDIGVLHAREPWLQSRFGNASGEGKRFVLSELRSLWPGHLWLIPSALLRTLLKLLGYKLGKMERRLGVAWKRRLSMHRSFWKTSS